MHHKVYFLTMLLAAIIGWLTWVIIILNINPFNASKLEILLFYITLLFALLGTIFLFGWFMRSRFIKRFRLEDHLGTIWRQSVLITFLVLILLFFQSAGALLWWVAILPILAFIMLEIFFVTYERKI